MKVDVRALLDASKKTTGGRCGTCLWLRSRPANEQEQWESALVKGSGYDAAQIARAMNQVKSNVKAPGRLSVQRHRRYDHKEVS